MPAVTIRRKDLNGPSGDPVGLRLKQATGRSEHAASEALARSPQLVARLPFFVFGGGFPYQNRLQKKKVPLT